MNISLLFFPSRENKRLISRDVNFREKLQFQQSVLAEFLRLKIKISFEFINSVEKLFSTVKHDFKVFI